MWKLPGDSRNSWSKALHQVWASGIASSSEGCPECKNTNLGFEKSFFVSDNIEPTRTLIHQFKYKKHMCLAIPLGSLLVNLLHQKTICEIDLVVPVPLHWKKKQERGFNQSELMAKKNPQNIVYTNFYKQPVSSQKHVVTNSTLTYTATEKC